MKKIAAILVSTLLASTAFAQHGGHRGHHPKPYYGAHERAPHYNWGHHGRGGHHRGHGDGAMIGALILGGVVGAVIASQPQPQQPVPVYEEVVEYNPNCNCYVRVTRQVGWR